MTRREAVGMLGLTGQARARAQARAWLNWGIWTRQDRTGQEQVGIWVELDIDDREVRAFEVLASWRMNGLKVEKSVVVTRGEHGLAHGEIQTGSAQDIQVRAWTLRRGEETGDGR